MATWYLLTNFRTEAGLRIAGELIDDAQENIAQLQMAGAMLASSSNVFVAVAATYAVQLRLQGVDPTAIEVLMQAAYQMQQQGEVLSPSVDAAAVAAIASAVRQDGSICIKLDDYTPWVFEGGSAVGADAWHIVPTVGTGRWVRRWPSLADLANVAIGAGLIGSNAAGHAATTVVGQLAEDRALINAGMQTQKRTLHVVEGDFAAVAAHFATLNLDVVLPANSRIMGVEIRVATPFTGGGAASCVADIGTAGDPNAIVAAADVFAAAVDGEAATIPHGIAPNKMFAAAGMQLTATFTASVNLQDLTAGACDIDVLFIQLA